MFAVGYNTYILFRWLNFIVIIGFLVYLFRAYFLKDIKRAIMEDKKRHLASLHNKNELFKQVALAKRFLKEQERFITVLRRKFSLWEQVLHAEQARCYQDQSFLKKEAMERLEKQDKERHFVALLSTKMVSVVDDVERELKHTYTDVSSQKAYIAMIRKHMHRSQS
ncbi:MAG: hypothetical protein WBQ73_02640 [Candidatus Babeliales bacterium]